MVDCVHRVVNALLAINCQNLKATFQQPLPLQIKYKHHAKNVRSVLD